MATLTDEEGAALGAGKAFPAHLYCRKAGGVCLLCGDSIDQGTKLWPYPLDIDTPKPKHYVHLTCAEAEARIVADLPVEPRIH